MERGEKSSGEVRSCFWPPGCLVVEYLGQCVDLELQSFLLVVNNSPNELLQLSTLRS